MVDGLVSSCFRACQWWMHCLDVMSRDVDVEWWRWIGVILLEGLQIGFGF